jgi:hypothetical protein
LGRYRLQHSRKNRGEAGWSHPNFRVYEAFLDYAKPPLASKSTTKMQRKLDNWGIERDFCRHGEKACRLWSTLTRVRKTIVEVNEAGVGIEGEHRTVALEGKCRGAPVTVREELAVPRLMAQASFKRRLAIRFPVHLCGCASSKRY